MSGINSAVDDIPDTATPTLRVPNMTEEGSSLTGKSLTVLTRPARTPGDRIFHEPDAIPESNKGHQDVPQLPEQLPSFQIEGWRMDASISRHLTSTPPPDETPVTQSQLVTGTGSLFPSLPSSRASSLTFGSETPSECPATPLRRSGSQDTAGEEDLTTPVATEKTAGKGILFPPDSLWTPPDSTPRRQGKRTSSPPASPRPPKVARFPRWQAPEDLEDEGFCEGSSRELELLQDFRVAQQGFRLGIQRAFRNARQRGSALIEFQQGAANTPGYVFGTALAEDTEQPNNDDAADLRSPSMPVRSPEDSLRSSSISTSINCQYGQDEFVVAVEWFTEDEIERQLSEHLGAYRAVFVEFDETNQDRDEASADLAQYTVRTLSAGRLSWEDTDAILREEEEEDILDQFMTWVKEIDVPSSVQTETFIDSRACLGYLKKLTISSSSGSEIRAWPFVRRIKLWSNGCMDRFLDGLPGIRGVKASGLSFDGAAEWEFDKIYCGLGGSEVTELVAAWDNLMIRDE